MNQLTTVFAYLGPETMLPMTSVVAGVAGVMMMFGRNLLRGATGLFRGLIALSKPSPKPSLPRRRIGKGPVGRPGSLEMDRQRTN